jgi:hypothetical protein
MKILVLDGTAISIQVAMTTSAATTNPTFVSTYADNAGSGITEGATDGALNGSTDVTVVPAPTGSNRRVIKGITIFNGDTAAVTVLIKYDNNATQRTLVKVTLAVGDTWTTDGVFDANGNLKQTMGTVNLATQVTGTLPIANGGTGATTLAGANIPVTNVANTFTGLQTFAGSSSVADLKTSNILETATVSATAATGTIAYDVTTQSVLYYTTDASGNFTVNFRGSSGTSLDTIMATGESLSATFLVTNGATAYYNSAVQVDGSSVTPKWQGGSAPTSGNASSIDSYTYVIIKTGKRYVHCAGFCNQVRIRTRRCHVYPKLEPPHLPPLGGQDCNRLMLVTL